MHQPILFCTDAYRPLAEAILAEAGGALEAGRFESRAFPDGERYVRLVTRVFERNVVFLSGTSSDRETLDTFDMACAITKYGARSLTLLVPYYGYSTMERIAVQGEVVKAKTRARLLSGIPPAAQGNRIFLLDLHSPGITHYFEGTIRSFHVTLHDLLCRWIKELVGPDAIIASTDAGRAKTVQRLADQLGRDAAFVYKRRLSGRETRVVGCNADVRGREVLVYDDMVRSGGTLLEAARVYRDQGATRLVALTTHLVLPGEALERLAASGLFEKLVGSDSHPRAQAVAAHPLVEVRSLAPTLARLIVEDRGWGWPAAE